jgi:hypothetical protein
MNHAQRCVAGALGLTAAVIATSTPAAFAATKSTGPGALPAVIVGNPKVTAGATEGFFVWHDLKGFHLWVTHPGSKKVVFTGTITASAPIHYTPAKLESGDTVAVAKSGRSLTFSFKDFGKIDGLTVLASDAAKVRFTLDISGKAATTSEVFLGKHKSSPTSVPFLVERGKSAKITS